MRHLITIVGSVICLTILMVSLAASDTGEFSLQKESSSSFESMGFKVKRDASVTTINDLSGMIIKRATPYDGEEKYIDIYISAISYGILHNRIVIAQLSGVITDGEQFTYVNQAKDLIEIGSFEELAGFDLLMACGTTRTMTTISSIRYGSNSNGYLIIEDLSGITENGNQIYGPLDDAHCQTMPIMYCIPDPSCSIGCADLGSVCECPGTGNCSFVELPTCVNVTCNPPKHCYDEGPNPARCECRDIGLPTISQIGIGILVGLLLLVGVFKVRRRAVNAPSA